ncbi:hypothetical protein QQZ08_008597 [Neonectria magnoliae]|uniref:tyrosinase n=1 Tax=Neonectria magnoliae TaxID=2732573 RepID=A0ABR1HTM9_9HYPO
MSDDTGTYAITGIPPPEGLKSRTDTIPYIPGMPLRHEISALANPTTQDGRDQWTLFVLALEKFKAMPVNEKLSYFQIAGIHDYPRVSWDQGNPEAGKGSYCTHNKLNFSTWHRVYMLLFEQLVWKNMGEVIDDWKLSAPETARWKNAANTWRMPYWDWARKQTYTQNFALPEVLTQLTVEIFPPESLKDKFQNAAAYPNPLYSFENPEKNADGSPRKLGDMPADKVLWNVPDNDPDNLGNTPANPNVNPWSLTTGTGRWGIEIDDAKEYTGLTGVNNFNAANDFIANMQKPDHWYAYNPGNLSDSVNRMLSKDYNHTWGTFASTKWINDANKGKDDKDKDESSSAWLSLEYVHNNVHNITGGSNFDKGKGVGHMSDVPVAAFDPIFWLHHCQIDRLLAIWQALHWDLWWDAKESAKPGIAPDATEDTLLHPFHTTTNGNKDTDVWTSKGVRDWTKLHYQYDDLEPKPSALKPDGSLDEAQYKTDLEAYVHETYPGTAHVVGTIRTMENIRIPKGLSGEEGKAFDDYIINVKYDRYALGGTSYSIRFFLGGPKNKPQTEYVDENYVGEIFTFTAPFSSETEGGCENCKKQAADKVLSQGQIPITIQLLNHIYDKGANHPIQEYEQVAEYLRLHLNWKFVQHGGRELDAKGFPNTEVSVLQGTAKPRYTKPEKSAAADVLSVASLAVNFYAAEETNELVPVSTESVPKDSVALPPKFYGYTPVYEATKGKDYGLEPVAV